MVAGDGATAKVDLKRELACYRATKGVPRVVTVPELQYLMIDGHGDPNTPAFEAATATLYPVAYALKSAARAELGRDHVVMPLEGLWWAEDMASFTDARDTSRWDWTLMILQPDWITEALVGAAVEAVARRGAPDRLPDVRLGTLAEGLCVQALHVGAYDDEGDLLRRMHHEVIPDRGLRMSGKHHEIYLSDARRVEPARLRTILRQPVAPAHPAGH